MPSWRGLKYATTANQHMDIFVSVLNIALEAGLSIDAIDAAHAFVCAMPYWWPIQVFLLTCKVALEAHALGG